LVETTRDPVKTNAVATPLWSLDLDTFCIRAPAAMVKDTSFFERKSMTGTEAVKAIMSGRADEVIDLAKTNLWR
jgi:hypothetical protein